MRNPHLLLALAALFWGGHWIVARAIVPHASPVSMAFWRWAAAIALLAPFAAAALVREWPAIRRAWLPVLFFGTCGTVVYNSLSYFGVRESSATNALLFQSLTPALIPLFGWILFRERIALRTAAGLALSFAGVLALVSRLSLSNLLALDLNPGDLFLIGNVALWALFTACLRWKPRGVDEFAFMLAVMLAGMLTGVPAWLADLAAGGGIAPRPGVLAGILYLAAFPSILCYVMWNYGVARIGPARAGIYLHVTPLAGVAMAVAILGEMPGPHHLAGFVLIVAGVLVAQRRRA